MTPRAPTRHYCHVSGSLKRDYRFFSSVERHVVVLFHLIFLSGWSHIEFQPGFATIWTEMLKINARSCVRIQLNIITRGAATHIL